MTQDQEEEPENRGTNRWISCDVEEEYLGEDRKASHLRSGVTLLRSAVSYGHDRHQRSA